MICIRMLVVVGVFILGLVGSGMAACPPGCANVAAPPSGGDDWSALQSAVSGAVGGCLDLPAGTYRLSRTLTLPPGFRLRNLAPQAVTVQAITSAPFGGPLVQGGVTYAHDTHLIARCDVGTCPSTTAATVCGLTLDGNVQQPSGSTAGDNNAPMYAIGDQHLVIEGCTIRRARCAGVSVARRGVEVRGSTLEHNGRLNGDPSGGPCARGAGIAVDGAQDSAAAPLVFGSTIRHSWGPGIDVRGANGGTIDGSTVQNSRQIAGISLYAASGWTVRANNVSQADDSVGENATEHPSCTTGPAGAHAAAILLCEDGAPLTVGGAACIQPSTRNNRIEINTFAGPYGILTAGSADDPPQTYCCGGGANCCNYSSAGPARLPASNVFDKNTASGAHAGCADDTPAGFPFGPNLWTLNTCFGPQPTYY
jgi:parallel beta-helix repeat protein